MGFWVRERVWWVVAVIIILEFIDGSEGCLEEEREALLKLKEAFNYPNGSSLPSWNKLNHSDCCSWEGITCDNSTQRVISLLLNNIRAQELEHFKWSLNVSYFLPFHQLQELDLSGNYLSGLFGEIRLANLQSLYLEDNQLTEIPFFDDFHSHNSKALEFSPNYSKDSHPEYNTPLTSLTSLETLSLRNNSLKGSLSQQGPIPEGFCNLVELKYLDLSQNRFNGTLPSCLNMPSLRYLHLHGNDFTGPIPFVLAKSPLLLTLDLTKNRFSGQIPWWFKSMLNLRVLLLKGNELEGSIPMDMCKLKNISILDLSQNKLSGWIPYCLNNITFRSKDEMGGTVLGKIFVPWTTRSPFFDFDQTSGELVQGEDERNFAWYKEEEVNFMSKSRNESYEGNILNFMSSLDLSDNQLTGEIPLQIGYLDTIHTLNLSNNYLTGPIPETFCDLKQIESLDLSYNKLTGHIPSQLIQLYSLSVFSVAHNNLSGMTPEMKNQFSTFDPSCYEGNPFLCGPPLQHSCSSIDKPTGRNIHHSKEDGFRDAFLWCFGGAFGVFFIGVISYMYLNSYFTIY